MPKDLPPEERLLRLIKGVHKKDRPAEEELQRAKNKEQRADIGIQRETPEKEKPGPKRITIPISFGAKESKLDPFKAAIFLLIGLFVIGILYFTYELFGQRQKQPIIDIEELIPPEVKPTGEKPAEEQEPAAEEEEITAEEEEPPEIRELFGAPVTRETPSIAEEGSSLTELAKDLVLIGVISGDNPQAIIRDKRTRQTFYVYVGESVLELKIKKIEKATVILEYNEETLKLSL